MGYFQRPTQRGKVVGNDLKGCPGLRRNSWCVGSVTGLKIRVSPCDFPQLIKFQAMFKEPTKTYIFCETSLSIPDKSVLDLSSGLLQFLPNIPIIKDTLVPALSS